MRHFGTSSSKTFEVEVDDMTIGILQEQGLVYNEKISCKLTKFDEARIKFDGATRVSSCAPSVRVTESFEKGE